MNNLCGLAGCELHIRSSDPLLVTGCVDARVSKLDHASKPDHLQTVVVESFLSHP